MNKDRIEPFLPLLTPLSIALLVRLIAFAHIREALFHGVLIIDAESAVGRELSPPGVSRYRTELAVRSRAPLVPVLILFEEGRWLKSIFTNKRR